MSERQDYGVFVATIGLALLVILGAYAAGYVALPFTVGDEAKVMRAYSQEWQATIYQPAARVDSLITGREVIVFWWTDNLDSR